MPRGGRDAATISDVDSVGRLLQPETITAASAVRSQGRAWNEGFDGPSWGTGFLVPFPRQPMLSPASFGHDGAGGSIAFADPDLGAAFSHVVNQMVVPPSPTPGTAALLDAMRSSLG